MRASRQIKRALLGMAFAGFLVLALVLTVGWRDDPGDTGAVRPRPMVRETPDGVASQIDPTETPAIEPLLPTPAPEFDVAEPTPNPDDPVHIGVAGEESGNIEISTDQASIIAIGTVKQVMPARWSTPDGLRPANPRETSPEGYLIHTIFRPVLLEVEQYLKGEQSQRELLLFAWGGTVGADSVEISGDPYEFREGERVIVFLVPDHRTHNNSPLLGIVERYTITPDGQAVNSLRSVPLQELIKEIQEAERD